MNMRRRGWSGLPYGIWNQGAFEEQKRARRRAMRIGMLHTCIGALVGFMLGVLIGNDAGYEKAISDLTGPGPVFHRTDGSVVP